LRPRFLIRARWDSSIRIPPPSAESSLLLPEVGSNLSRSHFLVPTVFIFVPFVLFLTVFFCRLDRKGEMEVETKKNSEVSIDLIL
jgi:hypothetical protein